jgi:hypothetical protein
MCYEDNNIKIVLKKCRGKAWTVLNRHAVVNAVIKFWFHKMWGFSWLGEELLASQELCSVALYIYIGICFDYEVGYEVNQHVLMARQGNVIWGLCRRVTDIFWDVMRRRMVVSDVSGQAVRLTLEGGTYTLSQNIDKYQSVPCNIPEERRSQTRTSRHFGTLKLGCYGGAHCVTCCRLYGAQCFGQCSNTKRSL